MRKLLSVILVFVLLLSVMTSFACAVSVGDSCCGVANVDVYFRESNDSSSSDNIICVIPSGSVVTVLYAGSSWHKILYNGQIGYCAARYYTLTPHEYSVFIGMSTDCTVETINTYTCIICGYEYSEVVPAPGHDLVVEYMSSSGGEYVCSEGGIKKTYCTSGLCGYVEYEPFSGHVLASEMSISTNCEDETYLREYCTLCNWEDVTVIPAPGHEYTEVSVIKPTYYSDGTQTVECSRCGHRDYITIPMLIDDGMSPDVFAMGQAFMSGAWKLFGVYVPGFGFTFGGLLIGVALVGLSLSVISMIFGFGGRRGGSVSARSGSINKAKISKERENDER